MSTHSRNWLMNGVSLNPSYLVLLSVCILSTGTVCVAAQEPFVDTIAPAELVENGTQYLAEGTEADIHEAIEYFYRALEIDLDYAPAYTQLSNAFRMQTPWDGLDRHQVDMAISYGEKAVALASEDPEARTALGYAYYWKRWYRQAYPHFERADELRPTAETAAALGVMQVEMGNFDQALLHFERSFAFDSTDVATLYRIGLAERMLGNPERASSLIHQALAGLPDQPVFHAQIVFLMLEEGSVDEAADYAEALVDEYPEHLRLNALAGTVHWYAGRDAEALDYLEQVVELPDQDPLIGYWGTYASTALGHIYARMGHAEEAQGMFEHSLQGYSGRLRDGAEGWGYMYDLARVYAAMGDTDRALHWLGVAIEFGFPDYHIASIDPIMEVLEDDPAYQQLMAKLGLQIEQMRARAEAQTSDHEDGQGDHRHH